MLELLPIEILFVEICKFLSDKDFINLISVRKLYQKYHLTKKLQFSYKLSKIKNVRDKYTFIKIIYDLDNWNLTYIPLSVEKIYFAENYNNFFNNLHLLPNLRRISIKYNFTNLNSIENLPDNIENKYNIIIRTIINSFTRDKYEELLNKITKIFYPSSTPKNLYKIYNKKIKEVRTKINNYQPISKNDLRSITFKDNNLGNIFEKIDIFKEYADICKDFSLNHFKSEKVIDPQNIERNKLIKFINIMESLRKECYKATINFENKYLKILGYNSLKEYLNNFEEDYWSKKNYKKVE